MPASEYARLQWFLVAWLVGDCALLTWSNVPTYFPQEIANVEALIFPISISLCILYCVRTDRLVSRRQACGHRWALWWVYQAIGTAISQWARGESFYGDWYISFKLLG